MAVLGLLKGILDYNKREIARLARKVEEINALEPSVKGLSDDELMAKTAEFRERLAQGASLDDLLCEAFAVVREAAVRELGQRHFDVQLMGGIVLHEGKIAEMKTGEGKTLVATLAAYLNALTGQGVHVVTVNDYLAKRDAEWMGGIYRRLGLTVGVILHDMDYAQRRAAYACDITYGTNNEFGFDYLRDNLAVTADQLVQRELHYAIVDEVDSILIDEARTPLIISGVVRKDDRLDDTVLYRELKAPMEELTRRQKALCARLFDQAVASESPDERYFRLLQVELGDPKNERLLKYIADHKEAKKNMQSLGQALRAEERLSVRRQLRSAASEETRAGRGGLGVDEGDGESRGEPEDMTHYALTRGLLYVWDEKNGTMELTDEGQEVLNRRLPSLVMRMPFAREMMREIERGCPGASEAFASRSADDLRDVFNLPHTGGPEDFEGLSEEQKKWADLVVAERDYKSRVLNALNQMLRAYTLYQRDVEYVVSNGQVIIVDEFTGRLMHGRRYSDGLHEAIEAKEAVKIAAATQTVATITLQNFFRKYAKLAGMTGTAATEDEEFRRIYGLPVVVIPTNRPMIRIDYPDVIYKTARAKFRAIVDEICELHKVGRPVLVGTTSIEKSEVLSRMLRERGVPHEVLNAKHHEKEAQIIKQAGQMGAVTIATNMAGRGTDIMLGPGVVELGGLHVIGTERHEARRIDNQLRGRAGRQGDPGSSRFYVSLEDDLMRLFGGELIANIMERLGWKEDEPIEHPQISRSIQRAQQRVESRNFDLRQHVLQYDDVMNKQREVVYADRRQVIEGKDLKPVILDMIDRVALDLVSRYCDEKLEPDSWNLEGLLEKVAEILVLPRGLTPEFMAQKKPGELRELLAGATRAFYEAREKQLGPDTMRLLERLVVLRVTDARWMEHLEAMDELREGIGLQSYGQKDPLVEYRSEAHRMFQNMVAMLREDVVRWILRVRLAEEESQAERAREQAEAARHVGGGDGGQDGGSAPEPRRVGKKVGRNDPCPCGSGKKYKKCCGRVA